MVRRPVAVGRPLTRQSPRSPGTVVCVLGMHRSGTSLVSRLLNILGVYLGPEHSISNTGEDNPRGYWEHHPLALLNDEILARFGGRWDELAVFPDGWSQAQEIDDLKGKAREILADFEGQALWGWKDPRTCLTLPFWQQLVGPIRYVLLFRSPSEVIASLDRRNGMSAQKAERLWLAHVHAALAHTSGQPRMLVFYDDIMNNRATELARLAAFIGRPDVLQDHAISTAAADYLDETLRHHRIPSEDLAGDERISFAARGLYLAIKGHAPIHAPIDNGNEDRAFGSIDNTLALLAAGAVETWERSAASTRERDALARANHAQADAIAHLSSNVVRLTDSVASLTGGREAVVRQLDEIHTSAAWRLVVRTRRVIVSLFPAGTRRRRAFDVLLRRVATGRPLPRGQAAVDSLTA